MMVKNRMLFLRAGRDFACPDSAEDAHDFSTRASAA